MTMTSQNLSIHRSLRLTRKGQTIPPHQTQAILKGQGVSGVTDDGEAGTVYLVVQRRPLKSLPWLIQWLLRTVYFYYEWAASGKDEQGYFSVEYQGTYTLQADAYNAARADGFSYTELPLNASLPDETAQYGIHDFPLSDASHKYRKRQFEYVVIPRVQQDAENRALAALAQQIKQTAISAQGHS